MKNIASELLLIGVDGGATSMKAHRVREVDGSFELDSELVQRVYPIEPGFRPVPWDEQRRALLSGELDPTPIETVVGRRWIDAAAECVLQLVEGRGDFPRLLVGICMPGGKNASKNGIVLARNGPRIPDFVDCLEERLCGEGVDLVAPVPGLDSDGDACGVGEEVSSAGAFRGVENAAYLGGGTGLAEAWKLRGSCVPGDVLRPWLPKAWELRDASGVSFEDRLSMAAINAACGTDGSAEWPEVRLARGDATARAVLDGVVRCLAELLFERLATLETPPPQSIAPALEAPIYLDRIVLGQHYASLFGSSPQGRELLADLRAELARNVSAKGSPELRAYYIRDEELASDLLHVSTLRAAPCIGAAARVWRRWRAEGGPDR